MKKIKRNVLMGKNSNTAAITSIVTLAFTYGISYLIPENPFSIFLIQNKELIISSISTIALGLIFGVKK